MLLGPALGGRERPQPNRALCLCTLRCCLMILFQSEQHPIPRVCRHPCQGLVVDYAEGCELCTTNLTSHQGQHLLIGTCSPKCSLRCLLLCRKPRVDKLGLGFKSGFKVWDSHFLCPPTGVSWRPAFQCWGLEFFLEIVG